MPRGNEREKPISCWHAASTSVRGRKNAMYDMMNGGMMWGMGLWGLLAIVIVLLGVAALLKYLFFT